MRNTKSSIPLRIGFAGTPEFALPALKLLAQSPHELVAVYTQPDRPAGRGRKSRPSVVKALALELAVPVFQPESLKTDEAQATLRSLDLDVLVVVAYGLLLPVEILEAPRHGCLNIHGSLLPRWRGAAPLQRAMLAGDSQTGVTIMQMDAGLDTGPMIIKESVPIESTDTCAMLHDRLADLGAQLLVNVLPLWCVGDIEPQIQDHDLATYAAKLNKAEALIDWSLSAEEVDRRIRAFNPWPVAHTLWQGKSIRLWLSGVLEASAGSDRNEAQPGTVIGCSSEGIDVQCGQGLVRLLQIQLPGKRPVSCSDFVNGRDITGEVFGASSEGEDASKSRNCIDGS